jgi:hypothetical protein
MGFPKKFDLSLEELKALRKQGFSYAQIAAQFGVTRQAVQHRLAHPPVTGTFRRVKCHKCRVEFRVKRHLGRFKLRYWCPDCTTEITWEKLAGDILGEGIDA